MSLRQEPPCGDYLLRWQGDRLAVTLTLDAPRPGRAALRCNFGEASVRRREIIAETEEGVTPLARAWHDVSMRETSPGVYRAEIPLDDVGVFSAKACFFPAGSTTPEWPAGGNFHVKVEPARTRSGNAIYTVFPRPFGSFREVIRRLGHIMDEMGFRIIQTLPPFPVPTTYAVMGEYGCPFAATDFFSVDPAMAEFDTRATPLDQFRELIDAVHARGGDFFIDLPANHTGWASTLQTRHPEWFRRESDGAFRSPGAWGVVWADLVELDYRFPGLSAYMAEVFLFWCRLGVNGFRCDAGYMIPEAVWTYIVARVREEYPDTVFMLEGLGGRIETTDALLGRAGLDWAYSEIFQTYDRSGFEGYLPGAVARARRFGTLVHFAETHDNDRLAKKGCAYARLRVMLAALLAHQGAWGIANGVEWFATEKIDVHGRRDLAWGNPQNLVACIAALNRILAHHPDFTRDVALELIETGPGNFIAVCRGDTLILANLDETQGVTARWRGDRFPPGEVTDLMTGRRVTLTDSWPLEPAACVCLSRRPLPGGGAPPVRCAVAPGDANAAEAVLWHWPEDAKRVVCVPYGRRLAFAAACPYRAVLTDGARAYPTLPPYAGDGTRARELTLEFTAYAPEGVRRSSSTVLILPPGDAARVRRVWSGREICRADGLETVLSNDAGAAARVRVAWGEIRSQYDALFAANTAAQVPGDRLVLWSRCRAWLCHEGYSRELNRACIADFTADPAGRRAVWRFRVPAGMGRETAFTFTLSLAENANAARLTIARTPAGERERGGTVRLVLRPDLEWRSFHATTKAQGDVERAFDAPAALTARADRRGFSFNPYHEAKGFELSLDGAVFHRETEWTYAVSHAEEAARGQDGCGDLYSPGWIACDLTPGATATLTARYGCGGEAPAFPPCAAPEPAPAPTVEVLPALKEALRLFVVRRDDVKTVLAGFPWFLDWGRDTFIFLRGAIAAGFTREARAIVTAFARFEEGGTLPNIICGERAGNRDTSDAPLWFIVAVGDLVRATSPALLETDVGGRSLGAVLASIVEGYLRGTANGIRVDAESMLVWSPPHFTWMDTNYPACTPRVGYPVEIQALWIAALRFLGGKYDALADRAAVSLVRLFANATGLADCLDAPLGESAAAARRDDAVRPNQLFALTLGAVSDAPLAQRILKSAARLIVPGGMRSLDADDARYRGRYGGDEDTSRKPAYHNGTVWAWPFPSYAEAAVRFGALSRASALSLLASSVENLNAGCVTQISEIADGDAPHAQKGCRAQAWSVSELYRVWRILQDGEGEADGPAADFTSRKHRVHTERKT